ncbi:galactose-binding domain-containing protein [Leifsonia sp. 21MFCrub1.1]|uniref:galactose-binding domain-containing protein n=1 Tax=Leifsonia sp. 21MFCrub1.1 TaxID=1798223 RepID=UPI0008928C2E|nr:discoidin domain-containing protein [Leifsonia sp. 21MFCrub1.1]SEA71848.1 F5/8 type C domain-containing protein [Leifsonia sp. 21MFCrub1.1]
MRRPKNMRRSGRVGWKVAASAVVAALLMGAGGVAASAEPASDTSVEKNLALGGSATQSSTWQWLPSATADKAIDGNPDGTLSNGSVTHTDAGQDSWWQVDLRRTATISAIEILNRTDCCQERLEGARLFLSAKPFDTTLTPEQQERRAGVTTYTLGSYAFLRQQQINLPARYVMVQVSGWKLFSLAEVRVLGS